MGTARFVCVCGGGTLMFMKQKAETSEQNTGFVHALSAVMWQLKLFNPPPPNPPPEKKEEKRGELTPIKCLSRLQTEIVIDLGHTFLSNFNKNLSRVKWAMNSFCKRFYSFPQNKNMENHCTEELFLNY